MSNDFDPEAIITPPGRQRNLFREPDIENASMAADFLGTVPGASDDEIENAFRRAAQRLHPDARFGNAEAFKAAVQARELLEEFPGELADRATSYRAWLADRDVIPTDVYAAAQNRGEVGRFVNITRGKEERIGRGRTAPRPGQHIRKTEDQKRAEEVIKMTFIEAILEVDLSGYSTVDEAIGAGIIAEGDINFVERRIHEIYDIPNLTFDTFAEVLGSLLLMGSINLGDASFFASEAGPFGGTDTGVFGGNDGVFGRGGDGVFGGPGDGVFR